MAAAGALSRVKALKRAGESGIDKKRQKSGEGVRRAKIPKGGLAVNKHKRKTLRVSPERTK